MGKIIRTIAIIWVGNNEGLSWGHEQAGVGDSEPKDQEALVLKC